jgi:hypothetical protein
MINFGQILWPILGQFCSNFGTDFGLDFGADFKPILIPIKGPILKGATGAVGSHGGLKQHKVEKATELTPLFEVGRNYWAPLDIGH